MCRQYCGNKHGITFIDVLIGTAIVTMIFAGLFSAFRLSIELYGLNKARTGAVALGNERIEILRALPYDQVGTVGGLPPGAIPQLETVTYGGITFTVRTFIKYIDDPADSTALTGDLLAADYKQAKVEVSWPLRDAIQTVSFVTNMVPKGEESLAGAGVLRINVLDANLTPVFGALVHIVNNVVATSVDITTLTNASGTISFPGAWAGAGYQITVSKAGYSTAQTYTASSSNPNPSPSPATVVENGTTALLFQIDRTSSMSIRTLLRSTYGVLDDLFTDTSKLLSQASTTVTGGALVLAGGAGSYEVTGTAESITIAPTGLEQWLSLSITDTVPINTSVKYHILYDTGGGVYALIPDVDLSGNSTGLVGSLIDLHTLSVSTYPRLRLQAVLNSSNPTVTPEVHEWRLSYDSTGAAVPSASFSIRGTKTIGTDAGGSPVYKYQQNLITDGSGNKSIDPLEWDRYELTSTVAGYNLAEMCPPSPRDISPNIATSTTIVLAPQSTHTLTIHTQDVLGAPVPRVEVRVVGTGVDTTRETSDCGVAFFTGLTPVTYTVTTIRPGYQATSTTAPVSGATAATLILQP